MGISAFRGEHESEIVSSFAVPATPTRPAGRATLVPTESLTMEYEAGDDLQVLQFFREAGRIGGSKGG